MRLTAFLAAQRMLSKPKVSHVGDAGLWRLQRETLLAATLVLDWWHIAMRFEHALQAARGLADKPLSNETVRGLQRAK